MASLELGGLQNSPDRFAELASHYFLQRKSSELGHVQRGFGRLLLNSIRLSPDTIREYKRLTVDHRPRFLKGSPSALCHFATLLKESGLADLSFRVVFSTGEMLLPSQRSEIEETFHCQVFDSYGHMERTVAISQCGQGRYHVNPGVWHA